MTDLPETLSPQARQIILQHRQRLVDRSKNPYLTSLPEWVKGYRPHQVGAVEKIIEAFKRVDVVVLDAPTGAGKTLIAETVRRMMNAQARYVCSTKSLQDQFLRDYGYAKVIKGRRNYPTRFYDSAFPELSCDDCTANRANGFQCKWCGEKRGCPYEEAKRAVIRSAIGVVNTAYFLGEANTVGRISFAEGSGKHADTGLVIADEADTLEGELMSHVSVEITPRRARQFGWQPPAKVTVDSSWKEWIDAALPDVNDARGRLDDDSEDPKVLREIAYLEGLYDKLLVIRKGLDSPHHPWVYTGKEDRNGEHRISFQPARVDAMGEVYLWRHSKKWLLMSATVISAQEMLDSLGWRGEYELVQVGSTFSKDRRPIRVRPVVNMSGKSSDAEKDRLCGEVAKIVQQHEGERVLVHSVSYDLTARIVRSLAATRRKTITYRSAQERDSALARYVRTPGAVLVAPSFDRGVDLPDDLCRVQIIAKTPFPYLGDRQVSKRFHSPGGKVWYSVQAARSIVQMTGRGVRNDQDWCVTYILDGNFVSRLYNANRNLFPSWWREALVFER